MYSPNLSLQTLADGGTPGGRERKCTGTLLKTVIILQKSRRKCQEKKKKPDIFVCLVKAINMISSNRKGINLLDKTEA